MTGPDHRRLRPLLPRIAAPQPTPLVLVVGAYLADAPTNVARVHAELARSADYRVRQAWAAVGGPPRPGLPTARHTADRVPKYAAVNAVLAAQDLASVEYLVVCDDDVELPEGFLDRFLAVQSALGFALAQPARTANSPGDHAIVAQQPGLLARETLFVEAGPCFCAHRTVFGLLLPFDLASPMGWGYEYVWARRLSVNGFRLGIVDAVPVEHTLRAVGAHYDGGQAYQQQTAFLAGTAHLSEADSHRVLREFPAARAGVSGAQAGDLRRPPPPAG